VNGSYDKFLKFWTVPNSEDSEKEQIQEETEKSVYRKIKFVHLCFHNVIRKFIPFSVRTGFFF